jgi:hypothetical protein
MFHHFSLDPRTILGVDADASPEEIHRAFLAKSKKYHPDHGGDEWAFKMVARAHEILKETRGVDRRRDAPRPSPAAEQPDARASPPQESAASPHGELFTVEAELVWIRWEGSIRDASGAGPGAMTLSVCLVVCWPRAALVRRSADVPGAAEALRAVIQAFEHLKAQPSVIGARSRIEDGQFVGWLSYPSVLQAEAAFHALRDELEVYKLGVGLRTRDEQVPIDWLGS